MRQTRFLSPEHSRLLNSPSWTRCEKIIKSFEEAWRRGESPTIEGFLNVDGPERHALLVELVHVDLEIRLRSNEAALVETYLKAFPDLARDRHSLLELIAAEFELREMYQGGV